MNTAPHQPSTTPSRDAVGIGSDALVRRLRGLEAAQLAIDAFIAEARRACEPYGKRQGRSLAWWQGQFDGLVAASAMLTLADYPEQPDNAEQIVKLLKPNK